MATTEYLKPCRFVGITQRKDRNDAAKVYAEIHVADRPRDKANEQVGATVTSYNADVSLFRQLMAAKFGDPLNLVIEEFEWIKDGVTQSRKTAIGIEPAK